MPSRPPAPGHSYVLTTGTGSGKSLAYIVPIVDKVLRARVAGDRDKRVRAIIVYPMNALANSQYNELKKYLRDGFPRGSEPVTFARYTGQEGQAERDKIRNDPPDILLTNYVMLELMLTRPRDRQTLIHMARGLEFLVFDELHTYRGRQGADVALLIRRVKDACAAPGVQCVGTSATMSTEGTGAQRRTVVAGVATEVFGTAVSDASVIGETLIRATDEDAGPVTTRRINAPAAPVSYGDLVRDPLAAWIETTFGLDRDDEGNLARRKPVTVQAAAQALAEQTGTDGAQCEKALQRTLQAGSRAPGPEVRPAAVRVPAAPVPVQGRYRLRDPGGRGQPADHPGLPDRASGDRREHPAAAGVLPRMRPGVPGGLASAAQRRGGLPAPAATPLWQRRRARTARSTSPRGTSTSPATCRGPGTGKR